MKELRIAQDAAVLAVLRYISILTVFGKYIIYVLVLPPYTVLSICSYHVRHFHSEEIMDHAARAPATAARSILPCAVVGQT